MKRFTSLFLFIVLIPATLSRGVEPIKGYKWYVDISLGNAYNFNTAQTISTNNMQLFSEISTTHGYALDNWFLGGGIGYYHSFRDGENMYPLYTAVRYTFGGMKLRPFIEARAGIVCDPRWVRPVQVYGVMNAGVYVYKKMQAGIKLSIFSRPSRYFAANAAVVLSYAFGR